MKRIAGRFLRLIVYLLLFDRKARDWVDGTLIGYDKAMALAAAGFEPQWHHIYPRSVLKRVGCQDDEIHAIANITVLNERTNANKLSDKEPWEYIKQFGISAERLREHLVPEGFIENPTDDIRLKARYEAFFARTGSAPGKRGQCVPAAHGCKFLGYTGACLRCLSSLILCQNTTAPSRWSPFSRIVLDPARRRKVAVAVVVFYLVMVLQ